MRISELKPGDVIFTMLGQKPPALHTQMFVGQAHFQATTLHAVDGGKFSKLMATSLRADENALVFRCIGNDGLVSKATKHAFRWAQYETPYDQERKILKEGYRNYISVTGQDRNIPALQSTLFKTIGKFRAIKYAARRNGILCYPNDEGGSRGLTCTMFVILCYQVAGIGRSVRKTHQFPGGMVRVSDKKLNTEEQKMLDLLVDKHLLNAQDVRQYKDYLRKIQSGNEFEIDWSVAARDPSTRPASPRRAGYQYVPSILCWDHPTAISAFNFGAAMTPALLVDAKITTSDQLRICMEADRRNWECKGYIDTGEQAPFESDYKKKVAYFENRANELRKGYAPRSPMHIQKPPLGK